MAGQHVSEVLEEAAIRTARQLFLSSLFPAALILNVTKPGPRQIKLRPFRIPSCLKYRIPPPPPINTCLSFGTNIFINRVVGGLRGVLATVLIQMGFKLLPGAKIVKIAICVKGICLKLFNWHFLGFVQFKFETQHLNCSLQFEFTHKQKESADSTP